MRRTVEVQLAMRFKTKLGVVLRLYMVLNFASSSILYEKIITVQNLPQMNVHELMVEDELLFYFGTTFANRIPRYELIKFPFVTGIKRLQFTAFNKYYNLNFEKNNKLLSPDFKWYVVDGEEYREMQGAHQSCHYLHLDGEAVAAFSFCEEYINGLILSDDTILEVKSLNRRLHSLLKGNTDEEIVNIVKPAYMNSEASLFDEDDHFLIKEKENPFNRPAFMRRSVPMQEDTSNTQSNYKKLTLEAGLFFDEKAYKSFAPYFEYDTVRMKNMLLAYMNMVQALYYEPSLGTPLDIVLVKLEIFQKQPDDLPHYYGERSLLLDSFCNYNKKHNAENDQDPAHWDIGLYISGLDFYAIENGVRSGGTMGLATVGGICSDRYSCIISEFGATNEYGKPYPSAGFSSVYILAHEIGHNLGMQHDGTSNNCAKDGFIMSPSRGVYGETVWSRCSATVMYGLRATAPCLLDSQVRKSGNDLDHNTFALKPGLLWNAKKQCEILLKDSEAYVMNSTAHSSICENLMCQSVHKSGFYHAGPALDGTKCDENKWCENENCVQMKMKVAPKIVTGEWSEWKIAECKSSCLLKSKGFQKKTRKCDNPAPVNTDEGCKGPSEDVNLCKDDKICKKSKRLGAVEYATSKCREFSAMLPTVLEPNGTGIQAPYEEARLWTSCSVFCKRRNSDTFYSPRIDLNDLNVDPYFPDGTWCHNDGKQSYYCIMHHCVPEPSRSRTGKSFSFDNSDDLLIPQDANSGGVDSTPEEIRRYLSVDSNGSPVLKSLAPNLKSKLYSPKEWYVDLGGV